MRDDKGEIEKTAGRVATGKRVGELLVEGGLLRKEQLAEALETQKQQGGRLLETLVEMKCLSKEQLHEFLSSQSGVPSIDLANYEIPRDLRTLIPGKFAREHVVLPIDKMGRLLTVGMACPLDKPTILELERLTGLRVKPMLCKLDDIQKAIRRYYAGEPGWDEPVAESTPDAVAAKTPRAPILSRKETLERLDRIDILPPYPGTLDQVKAAAAGPAKSLRDFAAIVSTDPALTAYFVHVANSVPYGLAGKVDNINVASILLGTAGITALAALHKDAPEIPKDPPFDYQDYWTRSMFCAAAAMAICRVTGQGLVADAYTAGLLHDIGYLPLAVLGCSDDHRLRIRFDVKESDAHDTEQEVTHIEAGFLLARRWQLPAIITNAIRFHHNLRAEEIDSMALTVGLAALMSEVFEQKTDIEPYMRDQYRGAVVKAGLGVGDAIIIYNNVSVALKSAATLPEAP